MQDLKVLYDRFLKMKERRQSWESLWNECYKYALPQREHNILSDNYTKKLHICLIQRQKMRLLSLLPVCLRSLLRLGQDGST